MSDRARPSSVPHDVPDGFLLLGRLGKTFGLQGALRLHPLGIAEEEALFELEEVFVPQLGRLLISELKVHGNTLLVRFEAVRTPERARKLTGAYVYGALTDLPATEGHVYQDALTGKAVLIEGLPIGTVDEVIGVPGAQVAIVNRPTGSQLMIPLHAPYVELSETAVLVTDPPPGLIEEE